MTTKEYRELEFGKLNNEKPFLPLIKINTTGGDTKWLSITLDELKKIEKILVKNCKS